MRTRIGLRISSGRLAVRTRRSYLVARRGTTMVEKNVSFKMSHHTAVILLELVSDLPLPLLSRVKLSSQGRSRWHQ